MRVNRAALLIIALVLIVVALAVGIEIGYYQGTYTLPRGFECVS